MTDDLFRKHKDALDGALAAIRARDYWSRYPESPNPRAYGETASSAGEAAFNERLGERFEIDEPGVTR